MTDREFAALEAAEPAARQRLRTAVIACGEVAATLKAAQQSHRTAKAELARVQAAELVVLGPLTAERKRRAAVAKLVRE